LVAYCLLTAALAALTRSGFGVEQALSSRYTIYSLLFWCGLYVLALSSSDSPHRVAPIGLVLSVLLFFGTLYRYEQTNFFDDFKQAKVAGLTAFAAGDASQLSYPVPEAAAQILLEADQTGVFHYREAVDAPIGQSSPRRVLAAARPNRHRPPVPKAGLRDVPAFGRSRRGRVV
jgi:hypothetical protein